MIFTKQEAYNARINEGCICDYHMNNPDQTGVYNCPDCVIIQDPCGCGEDGECEDCRVKTVNELVKEARREAIKEVLRLLNEVYKLYQLNDEQYDKLESCVKELLGVE